MPSQPMSLRACKNNRGVALYGTDGEFLKWLPQTDWLIRFCGPRRFPVSIPDSEYENLVANYNGAATAEVNKQWFWKKNKDVNYTPAEKRKKIQTTMFL